MNSDAIYGGLASRWLANFESGADNKLAQLTDRILRTLELKARITKEVMPPRIAPVVAIEHAAAADCLKAATSLVVVSRRRTRSNLS
jgi:hypothetical protein